MSVETEMKHGKKELEHEIDEQHCDGPQQQHTLFRGQSSQSKVIFAIFFSCFEKQN